MGLFVWLLLCAFVGYCAGRKGRNTLGWGLAAVLFSPLIVGIALALTPDTSGGKQLLQPSGNQYNDNRQAKKYCPECGCLVDAGETYCPRCGEMIW